jgi:hypothetical protein
MPEPDLAAMETTLTELAATRLVPPTRAGRARRAADAFGRLSRSAPPTDERRAPATLAVPPPVPPESVTLARPFWIWATGTDDSPTDILLDEHIEPGNSWAKLYVDRDVDYLALYEVSFSFLWQNLTGAAASVDVTTELRVHATAEATAEPGWIPNPFGFWSVGTEGHTEVSAGAHLVVLEWWHQPPTQPVDKPGQHHPVIDVTADAGWRAIPWNGPDIQFQSVDATYHLDYPGCTVPAGESAVFQVALRVALESYNGSGFLDAGNGPNVVGCPGVRLGLRREPVVSG